MQHQDRLPKWEPVFLYRNTWMVCVVGTVFQNKKNSLAGNPPFSARLFFDNDGNQAHICGDSAVIHNERRFWVLFMNKAIDLEAQYDKIYRYCYFKLHSREAAEDITQETFLRFLQSESYQEKGKSLAYLYTIARNLCINNFRKALGEGGSRETHLADTEMEDRHRENHGEDKTEDVLLMKAGRLIYNGKWDGTHADLEKFYLQQFGEEKESEAL